MFDSTLLIILISGFVVSYLCICIFELIYLRITHGKVILTIKLNSFKFQMRSKYLVNFDFDEKRIKKYIKEYFVVCYKYYDERLLKSTLFVFEDNIYTMSETIINSIFYYSKFNKLRISRIGIPMIEKYSKHNKFDNINLAKLLIHEYLHHWSYKHIGSIDTDHVGTCWKTIR